MQPTHAPPVEPLAPPNPVSLSPDEEAARDAWEAEVAASPAARGSRTSLAARLGFGALAFGAGALGALTMRGKGSPRGRWFRRLDKPAFQPPSWVFGPVWSVLYGTIAYSGYRVWQAEPSPARTRALTLWGTQLALNAAWTPLFFGARKPALALADIAALDAAAAAYALAANSVDPDAALAVVPYLAWLAFATALNAAIVAKNH